MPGPHIDEAFRRRMEGWSLTTAQIYYRMPDRPVLLQSFLWQDWDLAPKFPELEKFLAFWERELDGPIHSVEVAHSLLVGPAEWAKVDGLYRLQ